MNRPDAIWKRNPHGGGLRLLQFRTRAIHADIQLVGWPMPKGIFERCLPFCLAFSQHCAGRCMT